MAAMAPWLETGMFLVWLKAETSRVRHIYLALRGLAPHSVMSPPVESALSAEFVECVEPVKSVECVESAECVECVESAESVESHYLARGGSPSSPALTPLRAPPVAVARGALAFVLRLPPCAESRFVLDCLPDPVGAVFHLLCYARARLRPSPGWGRSRIIVEVREGAARAADWRAGRIVVAREWARGLMGDAAGGRAQHDIAAEIKGVCECACGRADDVLHQAARCLQYDANGTAPEWLLDAVADAVRIGGHLGDPAWVVGRGERGWEEGGGGLFLAWLMGEGGGGDGDGDGERYAGRLEKTDTPPRYRRGPFPDLVQLLDGACALRTYDESWWIEFCGAPLPQLWAEFLDA
ncbi:hypothetical protein CC85DRAFT_288995 [Cutaneotrichosporon oleaginosum]|uniref:Uncharacterized protein n=1 Tax=Cutaneotrichosporon oleaginosum TaxID=879819 RepID=A0A0J1AUL1_9TREE|nr:uncharacterized protein CC85DRAFT_288995 [Cutaneotrichosporon oleaginosum]KLT38964.1 hypothetical protein CC85DRAFT_288995 [Cutaneotrichosporon oleaginosum]TXT14682.1 hypothetical protein COLE_00875 [Cutaneotrichosporon oleaginosum]